MNPAVITATTFIFSPHRVALQSLVHSSIAKQYRPTNKVKRSSYCRLFSTMNMADSSSTTTSGVACDAERSTAGTRYRVSSTMKDQNSKWVRISFSAMNDTTTPINTRKKQKVEDKSKQNNRQSSSITRQKNEEDATSCNDSSQESTTAAIPCIPESVLRYERQKRKVQAANRASNTNVNIDDHLRTVYSDDHVVVTDKPSGILCVPGVNKHKSLLDMVFEVYGSKNDENEEESSLTTTAPLFPRDSMIVHRLDMDTSGIVIFARTRLAMSKLHTSFRERVGTKKVYEALLVGWLDIDRWVESTDANSHTIGHVGETDSKGTGEHSESLGGGEIDLPLQRDHRHPPFMRVSTPESEAEAHQAVKDLNHAGYKKLIAKKPKPSTTQFHILSHEKWMGHAVTRVKLVPITGRTHQLRVHCAALGHPILGDPAYGFCGEAHPNGGFGDGVARKMAPTCAAFELRRDVEDAVRENGRTMCLHARRLTLDHPVTNEEVSFEVAPSF
mmetsp:Transcript_25260/g.54386  ORF Transcript_25260/g.54386 Transcript_25260/m.54386 type:complete len:501 (-) Transcript_25260:210-1712(-)